MDEAVLYAPMSALKRWLPVVAWSAVILLTSNNQFSSAHTGAWIDTILGFPVPHWVNVAFRKTLHLTGYGILGALAYRATEWREVVKATLVVALVASIDEWHQSTQLARRGSPWDVLLDVTGALLAIWLMIRVQQYRSRRRTTE